MIISLYNISNFLRAFCCGGWDLGKGPGEGGAAFDLVFVPRTSTLNEIILYFSVEDYNLKLIIIAIGLVDQW